MNAGNSTLVVSGEIDDGMPMRDELRELRGEVVGGRFMLGDLMRNASSIVFRATDLVLQRVAALELLLPPEDHQWSEADLMRTTAAVARRLRDHDRARVIDWGTDGEVAYVAIETDDGSDPTDLLLAPTPDQSVQTRTVGNDDASESGRGFDERPESLLGTSRRTDWGTWKRRAKVLGVGAVLAGSVGLVVFAGWWGLSDAHAEDEPECVGTQCWSFELPGAAASQDEDDDAATPARPDDATKDAGDGPETDAGLSQQGDDGEGNDDEPYHGPSSKEAAAAATDALRQAASTARTQAEEAKRAAAAKRRAERAKKRRSHRARTRSRARRAAVATSDNQPEAKEPAQNDRGASSPSITDLGEPKESDFRRQVHDLPGLDDDSTPYLANPFKRP